MQAWKIACLSSFAFPNRSRLLFFLTKYIIGNIAPIAWLITVAQAAPTSPHLNTATNRASRIMLLTPAQTVNTAQKAVP